MPQAFCRDRRVRFEDERFATSTEYHPGPHHLYSYYTPGGTLHQPKASCSTLCRPSFDKSFDDFARPLGKQRRSPPTAPSWSAPHFSPAMPIHLSRMYKTAPNMALLLLRREHLHLVGGRKGAVCFGIFICASSELKSHCAQRLCFALERTCTYF